MTDPRDTPDPGAPPPPSPPSSGTAEPSSSGTAQPSPPAPQPVPDEQPFDLGASADLGEAAPQPPAPAPPAPAAPPAPMPPAPMPPPALAVSHKLSPKVLLIDPVRMLPSLLLPLIGIFFVNGVSPRSFIWAAVGIAGTIIFAVGRWATFSYQIVGERLEIKRALIGRSVRTIPLERIRGVDVTTPPMHRLLSLAVVKIDTGASGGKEQEGELSGVTTEEAERLKAILLRRVRAARAATQANPAQGSQVHSGPGQPGVLPRPASAAPAVPAAPGQGQAPAGASSPPHATGAPGSTGAFGSAGSPPHGEAAGSTGAFGSGRSPYSGGADTFGTPAVPAGAAGTPAVPAEAGTPAIPAGALGSPAVPAGPGMPAVPAAEEDWAPEPEDRVIFKLPRKWLAYGPLSGAYLFTPFALAGGAVGLLFQWGDGLGLSQNTAMSAGQWLWNNPSLVVLAVVLLVVAMPLVGGVMYAVFNWDFTLREREGYLVAERGLLTRRSVSLEANRVRGYEIVDALAERWAGFARAWAVVTGLGDSETRGQLLPVVPREVALGITRDGIGPFTAELRPHPPIARTRRLFRAIVPWLAIAAVGVLMLSLTSGPLWWILIGVALLLAAVGVPLGLDRYRSLGHGYDGTRLSVRSGSIRRSQAVFERRAVVGWTLNQTWFQRRAGVFTMIAGIGAGKGGYEAIDVSEEQSAAFPAEVTPEWLAPFLASSTRP